MLNYCVLISQLGSSKTQGPVLLIRKRFDGNTVISGEKYFGILVIFMRLWHPDS